ncbi:hypothetical protein [Streptomyces sp. NPDC000931]|uniref:hypothetical protein n=1 Tax=Streptomyces sp. NPDC000931 TaxID=3154372 RepID=UPI00331BC470
MVRKSLSPAGRALLDVARCGDVPAVRAALTAGAGPSLPDAEGTTARVHAERRGFRGIAAVLPVAEGHPVPQSAEGPPGTEAGR